MVAQSRKAGLEARLAVMDILLAAGAAVDRADNFGSLAVHALQLSNDEAGSLTEEALDEQTRRLVAKLQPRRPDIFVTIADRDISKLNELLANDSSMVDVVFQGRTPLRYTIDELLEVVSEDESKRVQWEGLLEILKVLLISGADADGKMDPSTTRNAAVGEVNEPPLHKVLCNLRESYRKSVEDTDSETLAVATLTNAAGLLVEAGATLTPANLELLHQAARRNELAFAQYLIDCLQVDPNTKGRQGMTPLQFAARSGQLDMMVSKEPNVSLLLVCHDGIV